MRYYEQWILYYKLQNAKSIFPLQNRLGLKFERWVVCSLPGGVVGPTKSNEYIGCDKMNQNQPVIPADSKRTV